jgi:hypothetical protein
MLKIDEFLESYKPLKLKRFRNYENFIDWLVKKREFRRTNLDSSKFQNFLLEHEKEFSDFNCFGDIHFLVTVGVQDYSCCGPKFIYDVSRFLGLWFELKQKFLYTHSGNKRALKLLGIKFSDGGLEKKDLPSIFQDWDYEWIDDYLRRY